jgi:hypothetical protein
MQIDRAHPEVADVLCRLAGEGALVDAAGRRASLASVVVVYTLSSSAAGTTPGTPRQATPPESASSQAIASSGRQTAPVPVASAALGASNSVTNTEQAPAVTAVQAHSASSQAHQPPQAHHLPLNDVFQLPPLGQLLAATVDSIVRFLPLTDEAASAILDAQVLLWLTQAVPAA